MLRKRYGRRQQFEILSLLSPRPWFSLQLAGVNTDIFNPCMFFHSCDCRNSNLCSLLFTDYSFLGTTDSLRSFTEVKETGEISPHNSGSWEHTWKPLLLLPLSKQQQKQCQPPCLEHITTSLISANSSVVQQDQPGHFFFRAQIRRLYLFGYFFFIAISAKSGPY